METHYLLKSLSFYLAPSLLVALIPTGIVILIGRITKAASNWQPILICLVAGIIMWRDLAYWSMQGFLIFPFGASISMLFMNLFAIIGGIVGGVIVYRGVINCKKNKRLTAISLIGIGYFAFVFMAFLILKNRWVA